MDIRVHTRFRLAAAWASLMSCYIYADYFELYVPGKLAGMLAGRMDPIGAVSQGVLVGTGAMLTVPSLMILLSVILPPGPCRWINILLGVLYSVIQILVISGSGWAFYVAFGVVEIALTAYIAWTAWRWPRLLPQDSDTSARNGVI